MADGYLEKRMEESLSKNASKTKRTATYNRKNEMCKFIKRNVQIHI